MATRSYLFVPGDRPERFDKACNSGADVVVLDLEDAVTPERKAFARDAIAQWLQHGGKACVRLNGTDTEWYEEDCRLLSQPGITLVALPKAERAEQITDLAARLVDGVQILPVLGHRFGDCPYWRAGGWRDRCVGRPRPIGSRCCWCAQQRFCRQALCASAPSKPDQSRLPALRAGSRMGPGRAARSRKPQRRWRHQSQRQVNRPAGD